MAANNVTAATVIGDSNNYLSPSFSNQIETWLGQGSVQFTNVFTASSTTTNNDFHSSVGANPTLIVESVHVISSGQDVLIGGYNPQAWTSDGFYHIVNAANATAFLFNLTSNTLFNENTTNISLGQYQSYNDAGFGPIWGGGHDLYNSSATIGASGYALQYSYVSSTENPYTINQLNVIGTQFTIYPGFTINGLEAFTIQSAAVVPEPEEFAMMLLGLPSIGWVVRCKSA